MADKAYDANVEIRGETMPDIERYVMLQAVNNHWMEHLQTVDYIREGIGLRGYGQVDPLVAYKRETFDTFQNTLKGIRDEAARMIFHVQFRGPQILQLEQEQDSLPLMVNLDNLPPELQEQYGTETKSTTATAIAPVNLGNIDWKRVGRNDPCPCGSGKKFKQCHYSQLRAEGVI
jgi:preprotein translocase subunit SecA